MNDTIWCVFFWLQLVWQSLSPSVSLQMALFPSFLRDWVIFHRVSVPQLVCLSIHWWTSRSPSRPATVSSASVTTGVQVHVQIMAFRRHMARSGVGRSHNKELHVLFCFFNWSTIALQYCVRFCCTTKWIRYRRPPSWAVPQTLAPSHPSSEDLGVIAEDAAARRMAQQLPASWRFHTVVYLRWCSSQLIPPSPSREGRDLFMRLYLRLSSSSRMECPW